MMKKFTALLFIFIQIAVLQAQIQTEYGDPVVTFGSNQVGTASFTAPAKRTALLRSSRNEPFEIKYEDPGNWGVVEKAALEHALNIFRETIWEVTGIKISVKFGTPTSGGISSCAPKYISDIPYSSNTYAYGGYDGISYVTAFAKRLHPDWAEDDKLSGNLTDADMKLTFTPDKSLWYFGTNGNVPVNKYDFVTAVLREVTKGFGFISSVKASGKNITYMVMGKPTNFDQHVQDLSGNRLTDYTPKTSQLRNFIQSGNLYFDGHVNTCKLYAPAQFENLISVNYIDIQSGKSHLMGQYLNKGEAIHYIDWKILDVFESMGWYTIPVSNDFAEVHIRSNDIWEYSCIEYNRDYTFRIESDMNLYHMLECRLEILKKDGSFYEIATFEPNPYFTLNLSSIPDQDDWARASDGMVKARIYYKGISFPLGSAHRIDENDFYISIPFKPEKPTINVRNVQDMGWASHVTLEFTSAGAATYNLRYSSEEQSFYVSYSIPDRENIFTIEYVDLDVENYFTIYAQNAYGNSESVTLTYGGENQQMVAPALLSTTLEASQMNAYATSDNLSLSFESSTGISVETTIQSVEIRNLTNPLIFKKVQNYQSNADINISALPAGLYVVNATNLTGKTFMTKIAIK